MKKRVFVLAAFVVIAAGYFILAHKTQRHSEALSIADQEALLGPGRAQSNRLRVLLDPSDQVRGSSEPLVTLVELCDFRSLACKHVARALFEATLAYPSEVRVVFKPLPARDDPQSMAAAEAALAAGEQGKFWEMHDLLFASQDRFDRAGLEQMAQRLGLDVAAFRGHLDRHELLPRIEASLAYADKVGARSAPSVFVNGLRVPDHALTFVELRPRIEAEIGRVRSLVAERRLEPGEVYGALMRDARAHPLAEKAVASP